MNKDIDIIEEELRWICYYIKRKGREILKEYNITHPQFDALQIVKKSPNISIGEISQQMSLACSTVTDLIDRMKKANLVIKSKDLDDKRIVRINITEKGIKIINKVIDTRRVYIKHILEDKDNTIEMKRFSDDIDKFSQLLKQDSQGGGFFEND